LLLGSSCEQPALHLSQQKLVALTPRWWRDPVAFSSRVGVIVAFCLTDDGLCPLLDFARQEAARCVNDEEGSENDLDHGGVGSTSSRPFSRLGPFGFTFGGFSGLY